MSNDASFIAMRLQKTMSLGRTDEENGDVLRGKKAVLMREIGALPKGTDVTIDCTGAKTFSSGIVDILVAMRQFLLVQGARLECIGLSADAMESLQSHTGGDAIPVRTDEGSSP